MSTSTPEAGADLELRGIRKTFPGFTAVTNVLLLGSPQPLHDCFHEELEGRPRIEIRTSESVLRPLKACAL